MKRGATAHLPKTARLVALMLLWISRTLSSLLVACPLVFALVASGMVSGPERDAILFRRGSLMLLELLRGQASLLGAAVRSSLVLCALCAIVGLVPLGAALDLLETEEADCFAARLARGVRLWPGFVVLSVILLLAQAAILLASSLLGAGLSAALRGRDERLLTLAPYAPFALGLLSCGVLGAVLDIARGVLVQRAIKARAALLEALAITRARPFAVLSGGYAALAGSWFAWSCAAWVLTKIDLASPATRGIALAFVVHQLAIFLSIALRVRWLGAAIELGARTPSSLFEPARSQSARR